MLPFNIFLNRNFHYAIKNEHLYLRDSVDTSVAHCDQIKVALTKIRNGLSEEFSGIKVQNMIK